MSHDRKELIRDGMVAGSPLILGYFPIAMAYGLLAKNTGLTIVDTSATSMLVYAGASQFMFLDLVRAGVSAGSIILATFLLNLRHMMMSASLSVNLKKDTAGFLPVIGFGITDETFSVLSFNKDKLSLPFILTVNLIAYGAWASGTAVGYLVGEVIPQALQESLGLGLYAMFAALLFPSFKVNKDYLKPALLGAVTYIAIFRTGMLSSGWDIIAGIIIASALGVVVMGKEDNDE
ncbi:AzlC family ABC transporter permease [Gudongella sp. SC589]|uniref:AzlC family ABC transporter permease n=1 Tax=Gudongella sp. SC589 TaxID=3385990 RepID=UPI003904BDE8